MDHNKILDYYSSGVEKNRLSTNEFSLEGIRTKEIIGRYLPAPGAKIIDIGGGAGYYTFWLHQLGYRAGIIDLSPVNIEIASQYARDHQVSLDFCSTGNALQLDFNNEQFDVALLLGPLYHLINKEERIQALREAGRVLKKGGILFCAAISRYASLLDGFKRDLIFDKQFEKILFDDLQTGIHRNETSQLDYFTTAWFHKPGELKEEIIASGLQLHKIVAVESFGWLIDGLPEKCKNPDYNVRLQKALNLIEENEDFIAVSAHMLGIAKK